MMISKISPNVWKFTGSDKSNSYLIDMPSEGEKIIIDACNRSDRQEYIQFMSKVVDFDEVTKVIFTHLHYDHIGNFDLFKNAEFYASEDEIKDFNTNKFSAILSEEITAKFNIELKPLPENIAGLKIIPTPGHTKGSICIFLKEGSIMFTGDTIFSKKMHGRTDLPTSAPEKMNESLMKLLEYDVKIMAPGHDY